MLTEKKNKHTHQLKRLKYKSGSVIFFCALPDCTFKINISLALGKRTICWRCGDTFIMTEYALRLAKPHCVKCHHPKNEELLIVGTIVKNEEFMRDITLADRLAQAIKKAQTENEDEEI